ncbi:hypothetical protein L313_2796 [Acinetobacter haemolyticus CIP 64.3 = MTCC 9819]|uniref:Uncharacterized protein n=1 Tax=Acinetobacter haemolyticus CIP 64.3 = MTCC 9819 TaxID=1217659 RepID=N9EYK1_ACIHA|nr:hypothetical protein [Acinetobacter haemolyticus]ENW15613.1 hypothetical protein F927_03353 [Acinetobacter haemolyticus CIP 64.3 = MTCC 9819]EPR90386.1 hypothetical protein L313_2796 [Acinetobacter haemolyticus CIP 64.3 = MTCC 9819]NAR50335.1 hypothetical protein [Acinetobacter haemolyticus]NAS08134.1 hypothetical protein [Acinetobacter haemolyticus]QXZ26474.1 hypothetical protein I6L22_15090 [Acinetobacter haemolyticus]
MNAIKYIQQHGVDKARELLARLHNLGCPDDMQITVINGMWHRTANGFTYPDLKRLVESVDLVNEYGSLRTAKQITWVDNKPRLVQAIADYEAIYGGEHV